MLTTPSRTVWIPVRASIGKYTLVFLSDSLSLSFFSLSSYLGLSDDGHKHEAKCYRKTTIKIFCAPRTW